MNRYIILELRIGLWLLSLCSPAILATPQHNLDSDNPKLLNPYLQLVTEKYANPTLNDITVNNDTNSWANTADDLSYDDYKTTKSSKPVAGSLPEDFVPVEPPVITIGMIHTEIEHPSKQQATSSSSSSSQSPRRSLSSSSRRHSRRQSNPTPWYSSEEINSALSIYLGKRVGGSLMPPTSLDNPTTIKKELIAKERDLTAQGEEYGFHTPVIILPINLGTEQDSEPHWVALFINRPNMSNTTDYTITYVDPYGEEMPKALHQDLEQQYAGAKIVTLQFNRPQEPYDCGPLVVEALKHLAVDPEAETMPEELNIKHARVAHQALLEAQDLPEGNSELTDTPLMQVAAVGDLEKLQELLETASENLIAQEGGAALRCAAQNDHTAVVKLLLEQGAAVNEKDKNGTTALMYAAKNGTAELVQALLDKGANVMTPFPLRYAIKNNNPEEKGKIVKLISDHRGKFATSPEYDPEFKHEESTCKIRCNHKYCLPSYAPNIKKDCLTFNVIKITVMKYYNNGSTKVETPEVGTGCLFWSFYRLENPLPALKYYNNKEQKEPLLLTCQHCVIEDRREAEISKSELQVHYRGGQKLYLLTITLPKAKHKMSWMLGGAGLGMDNEHGKDIAVLRLGEILQRGKEYLDKELQSEHFPYFAAIPTNEVKKPAETEAEYLSDIVMFGYPYELSAANSMPLARFGHCSTDPKLSIYKQQRYGPDFYVDMASISGSSGSPIWLYSKIFEGEVTDTKVKVEVEESQGQTETSANLSSPEVTTKEKGKFVFIGMLYSGAENKDEPNIHLGMANNAYTILSFLKNVDQFHDHEDLLYTDKQIKEFLNHLLSNPVYVVIDPITDIFDNNRLLTEVARQAVEKAISGKIVVLPIQLYGNHWVGVVFRQQTQGDIQVIYNNPQGYEIEREPNVRNFFEIIENVIKILAPSNRLNIIDLQLRQQHNGVDSGPFTVDNLYRIANYAYKNSAKLDSLVRDHIINEAEMQRSIDGYGTADAIRADMLIKYGKQIDIKNIDVRTAFILAAKNGHPEVVKLLLEHGAQIDKTNSSGHTALMLAAQNGHLEVVKLLLEHGAQIDKTNSSSRTALMYAAQNGHLEVVKLLLDRCAKFYKKSITGQIAIGFAKSPEIKKLLTNWNTSSCPYRKK